MSGETTKTVDNGLAKKIAELIRRYGDDVRCVVHPDDLPLLAKLYPIHYREGSQNIASSLSGVAVMTSKWVDRGSVTFMPIVPQPRYPDLGDIGEAVQRIERLIAGDAARAEAKEE